jgi:hypothetical protein
LKRRIFCFILAVVTASQVSSVFADVANIAVNSESIEVCDVNITIDGENVIFGDEKPFILDNYTYVPLSVFEKTGSVYIDSENNSINISNSDKTIVINLDDSSVFDGLSFEFLANKPINIDGTWFLPVYINRMLGNGVEWNSESRTVNIKTPDTIASALAGKIKGMPLPKAFYILPEIDSYLDKDPTLIYTIALENADCTGYEELAAAMRKTVEEYKNGNSIDPRYMLPYYFKALDDLEDKSFLSGLFEYAFVTAENSIIIDENATTETITESFNAYLKGESNTVTATSDTKIPLQLLMALGKVPDDYISQKMAENSIEAHKELTVFLRNSVYITMYVSNLAETNSTISEIFKTYCNK